MNEQRIREIVARTYDEIENSGTTVVWPDDWEDAIEEAISAEVGQDVGGVLDGVVEKVAGQLPDPDWGIVDDHPEGEARDEAFHEYQRARHDDLVAAIARAIMAKLQDAGFHVVPIEE